MRYLTIDRNGEQFDLTQDNGYIVTQFLITAPEMVHITEELDGINKTIDLGTNYKSRILTAGITILGDSEQEFINRRNKIVSLFNSLTDFYLIDSLEPGKRWKVKVSSPFQISQINDDGEFAIDFISYNPFSESIGTTKEAITFRYEHEINDLSLNITENDYIINSETTFSIYNASNVTLEPRELPLLITYTGESNGLAITNETTGDIWSYDGTTVAGDIVKLDKVRSFLNGVSIVRQTNKGFITLAPGWNVFTLTGTGASFTIDFDFRFYYL